jgi:aryl-alcohol dehydrogenase-like predicted oxidoreductase
VREAVGAGVTAFDTADVYGSGSSERILGEALRGRRADVTISTKGGYVFRDRSGYEQRARRFAARTMTRLPRRSGSSAGGAVATPTGGAASAGSGRYAQQDFSPGRLRAALEDSLRRLRTDHVDVYLLHGPPATVNDVFTELDDLRRSGKVGNFGIGAESPAAAVAWTPHVSVLQLPFGVLDTGTAPIVDDAADRSVQVWARGVLGGGVLSAAMRDPGSVATHPKAPLIGALAALAGEAGIDLDELAIRWLRAQPGVDTMLIGVSSIEHLRRNVALARTDPLPADVRAAVDAVVREKRHERDVRATDDGDDRRG